MIHYVFMVYRIILYYTNIQSKAATEIIQILYNSETLQDSNTEHAQSIRYSLIILHIIYIRLTQIEKEEDVAISQLSYVIQMMGNLRLPFIMNGSNEILSILKEGFQYNVFSSFSFFIHSYLVQKIMLILNYLRFFMIIAQFS